MKSQSRLYHAEANRLATSCIACSKSSTKLYSFKHPPIKNLLKSVTIFIINRDNYDWFLPYTLTDLKIFVRGIFILAMLHSMQRISLRKQGNKI